MKRIITGTQIVCFCCWAILIPCSLLILTGRLELDAGKACTLVLMFITGVFSSLMIPASRMR